MVRVQRAHMSFAKHQHRTRAWVVFFFAQSSNVGAGGAFFAFFPARKCSIMQAEAVLQQEDGGIRTF
jgi:hypothetical protein